MVCFVCLIVVAKGGSGEVCSGSEEEGRSCVTTEITGRIENAEGGLRQEGGGSGCLTGMAVCN